MKLRVASIAFLLASAATGITWLSVQPLLVRLLDAVRRFVPSGPERLALLRGPSVLPLYLGAELLLVGAAVYGILYFTVARPLEDVEGQVERLEKLELELPLTPQAGPLLSRLQGSLRRAAEALRREQALTRRQLAELQEGHSRLKQAQTELVSAERLATVGKLAAGVAHEVGNPLSGILGYLSLARDRAGDKSPQTVELLDAIEQEVLRISGIVQGLLELGRPPRGAQAPVEVGRVAQACVKLLEAGPDFRGVSVELALAPPAVVLAEPGPLAQVLLNLLLNAAQAQEGKGRVRVLGRPEGEAYVVEVIDEGPGIPPGVLERLFEPFFTTKSAGKGTGLGLSVSRHLVEGMGGELQGANDEGGGGRFTLRLPAVRP